MTESKSHHCCYMGYIKEFTYIVEYDVSLSLQAPQQTRKQILQPCKVQWQYCYNLVFHQYTTECQFKLLSLFMMFCSFPRLLIIKTSQNDRVISTASRLDAFLVSVRLKVSRTYSTKMEENSCSFLCYSMPSKCDKQY